MDIEKVGVGASFQETPGHGEIATPNGNVKGGLTLSIGKVRVDPKLLEAPLNQCWGAMAHCQVD